MIELDTVNLDNFDEMIEGINSSIDQASQMAVNSSARYGHSLIKEGILNRVNLTSAYIGSTTSGKLRVIPTSKGSRGVARIQGRQRATMLHRFLIGKVVKGSSPRVSVKKSGASKTMTNAFEIRLANGNMGLVVRVKGDVDKLKNSRGAVKIKNKRGKSKSTSSLFLMYAPSISQIMSSMITKERVIQTKIEERLREEFTRQLLRLSS